MSDKVHIRASAGSFYDGYWLKPWMGTTTDVEKAYAYDRGDAKRLLCSDLGQYEIVEIESNHANLALLRRQIDDLQAANNAYLERARKAEASLVETDGYSLNWYSRLCRNDADKWYFDPKTGEPIKHNKAERIALMHSELSEALEGIRRDKQDDHLPQFKSVDVELADCLIRIFDFCGEEKIDIDLAFWAKRKYNAIRADHTHEARAAAGGKRF